MSKGLPLFTVLGFAAGLMAGGMFAPGADQVMTPAVAMVTAGGFLALFGLAIACFGIACDLWRS